MSATNSTPNYGLPQYVADDKPTYLGDFNKAMLDIDTNMKSIDNKASSAESSVATANSNASQALENANQASTKADNAQATATQAQSTANTAKTTADTAKTTATTASETANTALSNSQKALQNLEQFNLTESLKLKSSSFTKKMNALNIGSSTALNIIYDKTNKIFKLYGRVDVTSTAQGEVQVTAQTPFRPKEKISFQTTGIILKQDGSVDLDGFDIDTDGTLTCKCWVGLATTFTLFYFNSLYFLEAFDQLDVQID